MNARLTFVHALSPLHPGVGQGVGAIDLPVAREKATGLPFLPGSSLKGALREACSADKDAQKLIFGPDTLNADEHAGAAQFSDQRLLLLPARSLAGTFAWVTAPYLLRRFVRDAREATLSDPLPEAVPAPASQPECRVAEAGCATAVGQQVCLEDLDLTAVPDQSATQWGQWLGRQIFHDDHDWGQVLGARFCVVHDDVLNFLLETATEVTARVRLRKDAKTVESGALWYEEALPVETVLSGLVAARPMNGLSAGRAYEVLQRLTARSLQLGGKGTVGRGMCQVTIIGK